VAFTEDSLCDVLTELGALKRDRAMAIEAIAACESALATFQANNMPDLVVVSTRNLDEAKQLLASLN
jgi:hypothetical protein